MQVVHNPRERLCGWSLIRVVPVFPARSVQFGVRTANDRWPTVPATGRTGVNLVEVIHRSSDLFPTVDNCVDNYFHWVETTNPPAMKPKPTTMFQLPNASTGRLPWVT